MNQRIRQIREALGMSQESFAESIGLQRNSLSLIENEKRNPSERTINDICARHGISKEWLVSGTGEMFSGTPESPLQALVEKYGLSRQETALIEQFLRLDKSKRAIVTDFVEQIAAAFSKIKEEDERYRDATIESLESDYQKTLHSASRTASSASSTIEGTGTSSDPVRKTGEAG